MRSRRGRSQVSSSLPLLVTFLCPLLATFVCAQQPAIPLSSDAPYTINVSVDEVLLHATVRNSAGTPVSGLGEGTFKVFEDGVPQVIRHFSHNDIPVTVGLVIDNSGSMNPKR